MIAFGSACWAVGDYIRRFLFKESSSLSPLARNTLSFAAGNVTVSYILTALGFLGFFSSPVLWAVFLIGIGLLVLQFIARIGHRFGRPSIEPEDQKGTEEGRLAFLVLAIVIGLFMGPMILQAAAPPFVRDSLVYHLLCPKEYLKIGRLVHIGGNLYSAFPKGHEVLITNLLAIAGDRAGQGFSILQYVAMVGGIYSLTRLMAGPWTAALCSMGCATAPP